MNISHLICIGAALSVGQGTLIAQDAPDLNWGTYEKVRDYADRKASDKHYLKVPWKDTVLDGLIAGQQEDKPILLWLYFGDGRGNC